MIFRNVGKILLYKIFGSQSCDEDIHLQGITCSPLKVYQNFLEIFRLHFQSRRISRARNKSESRRQVESAVLLATCLHAGFLLCLFFDPEGRSDIFLRKVSWLSTDCKELHSRRQNSSQLCLFFDAGKFFFTEPLPSNDRKDTIN
jgi:hypothetical protein